jgi:hypothetical protein
MHRIGLFLLLLCTGLGVAGAHPLAGSWRLMPDRGTDLAAWRALDLNISVDGDVVTITRKFAAGRRTFEDVTPINLTKPTVVPVELYPDARYIGANISDRNPSKTVSGLWIGDGTVLRVNTDLELSTQQGEHPVNILGNYSVSTNGQQLTLIEIRSTRNQPLVYVFERLTGDEARATGTAE